MSQGSPKSKLLSCTWLASEMLEVSTCITGNSLNGFSVCQKTRKELPGSPLISNLTDSLKEFQNPQHTPITMKSMRVTPLAIV